MKVQNLATCLGRKGRSCCRVSWGLEGRDTKALTDRDHTWRADKWEGQNAGKLGFCFLHRAGVGKARGEVIMIGRGNGKPRSTFDTLAPCLPSFLPSLFCLNPWSLKLLLCPYGHSEWRRPPCDRCQPTELPKIT